MTQQNTLFDTSRELYIARHKRGIKLLRTDHQSASTSRYTVADILAFPFNSYFLDSNSAIQDANEGTAHTQAFGSVKEAIGKSVRDALHPEFAIPVINEDQSVIKSGGLIIAENQGKRIDDIELQCLTLKFPWYGAQNELIGIFGFSIMMKTFAILSIAESLSIITETGLLGLHESQRSLLPFLPGLQLNGAYLSKQEGVIAKLLARGKTAQAIGKQIGRSKRTVEHHIENIKRKTGCTTKYELIDMILDTFYLE